MNIRKLSFFTTILSGICLFIIGCFILVYINVGPTKTNIQNNNDNKQGQSNQGLFEGIVDKDPLNFLIMVKEASGENTDAIMILNYNPGTSQVSLLTIPRDTRVNMRTSVPKVNSAYALGRLQQKNVDIKESKEKGAAYAAQVVSDLTGIKIDYYILMDLSTVRGVADMLGGVYLDVPADMKYRDPAQDLNIDLKKGYQLLDGDKVEQFLRFRHPNGRFSEELKKYYDGSDLKRTQMQIKFLEQFIKQKVNLKYLPMYNSVANYVFEKTITNMPLSDSLKLANGLINISKNELNSFRLDGSTPKIKKIDYLLYNDTIINTRTKEALPESDVINQYFQSASGSITPTSDRKYKDLKSASDYKKEESQSLSNADSDFKGTGKDEE
jgi:LCP family protein required for cell wall assembly